MSQKQVVAAQNRRPTLELNTRLKMIEDIAMNFNRNGADIGHFEEKYNVGRATVTNVASTLRKLGINIPFLTRTGMYKELVAKWKREKPEIFTDYGLGRKK